MPVTRFIQRLPLAHRIALLAILLLLSLVVSMTPRQPAATALPSEVKDAAQQQVHIAPEQPQTVQPETYQLQSGDTLSAIFAAQGFTQSTLQAVLAADEELLALDVLRLGNTLVFHRAADGRELQSMELKLHPGYRIEYRHLDDGSFEFEEFVSPSSWHQQLLSGAIQGSFYLSAQREGLSDGDILKAQQIFDERINFSRDIRAGDQFEIILGQQVTDDGPTGETRIEGIRLLRGKHIDSAFLHSDSNYYDAKGESLSRAFLRYPTSSRYRISSPFNLHRLHPVTGRVSPHHGVDFAMPSGTPILSTADGIVQRVADHPYAGKYVVIQHKGEFKTRYLHLSRVLVKPGQTVTRGERIALSGNTGRTTGPHLHFELRVSDRPVNPLTADIPTATRIAAKDMPAFTRKVEQLTAAMDASPLHIAQKTSALTADDS